MNQFKTFIQDKPLQSVLLLAIFLRLIAAIFSKGYGMHDDHFSIIEASKSWVDGTDYNNWLPKSQIDPKPDGHSFFYVGIHYLLFYLMKTIGLIVPEHQMFVIRLLHAFYSLITVVIGYRIAEKISNKNTALYVGLLLASLWFMPFLSVRNLIEVVATPVLLLGIWQIIKTQEPNRTFITYLMSGLIVGIAFSIRFQTLIFVGGIGLALLLEKRWQETIFFGLGALISMVLVQGLVDFIIWGRPFAELIEYINYNLTHSEDYGTRNFWMYFQIIPGMLIPPVGVFLFIGAFIGWRRHLLIFLPTILFFTFHTLFPNKQERFIFTVIPMFVILGTIGWCEYVAKSKFWKKNNLLLKASYAVFIFINVILLSFLTVTYSKKARVETSKYLAKYQHLNSVVIEETTRGSAQFIPVFYIGKWITVYTLGKSSDADQRKAWEISPVGRVFREIYSIHYFDYQPEENMPQFVIFVGEKNITQRVEEVKRVFPKLEYETSIDPGFVDRIMYRLTPANNNQTLHLYRTLSGDYSIKQDWQQ